MIRLDERIAPDRATLDALNRYQREVNDAGDYAEQVAKAKERFSAYNKKGNVAFDAVKVTLTALCSGARRCCYCEDSCADEVEHVWPKDLYPELVFVWTNYLDACGPCNGPKNNDFAIFVGNTVQDIARPQGAPVVAPPIGDPLLIDPRREDPLKYLQLDLNGTWRFQASHPKGTLEEQRATYTLKLLNLNDRGGDVLTKARKEAYEGYLALLEKYVRLKNNAEDTTRTAAAIHRRGHPTVWREMQRQRASYLELQELFNEAEEALSW